MKVIKNIPALRKQIQTFKEEGKTIGFVPTMGALHEGHLSLIKLARQKADEVVISIFVNPEQFGPNEDFDDYPRSLQADVEQCRALGVSMVFAPSDDIIYEQHTFLSIQINTLNQYMDGGSRAGFFEGILLIVNKLFNLIQPDIAVFGQKDIQQFRILQQMVKEFNHSVELLMAPIIRAQDGLALSSRNTYLSKEQRQIAPSLYRSLRYLKQQLNVGISNISLLLQHQQAELAEKDIKIDYLNLFSFDRLAPVTQIQNDHKYILAGAVYVGKTRLIDNMIVEF